MHRSGDLLRISQPATEDQKGRLALVSRPFFVRTSNPVRTKKPGSVYCRASGSDYDITNVQ